MQHKKLLNNKITTFIYKKKEQVQSHIFELANYLSNRDISKLNLIGRQRDDAELLWEGIIGAQFRSDEEAMLHLYGDKNHSRKYFERTKRLLSDRLVNTILVKPFSSKQTDIQKAFQKCYKNLGAIKLLRGSGKRKSAAALGENTFKLARKFHLTEVALSTASELQVHYGTIDINANKYEQYSQAVRFHTENLLIEQRARLYYCELIQLFSRSKAYPEGLLDRINLYKTDLEQALQQGHDTYYIRLIYYNLGFFYHQVEQTFETLIDYCTAALNYFKSLPYTPPNAAFIACYFQMAPAYLQLKQFEQADQALDQCLIFVHANSYDWIACQQYKLMLRFHSGQFQDCFSIVQQVKRLEPYEKIKEQWKIYEAYVTFLALIGKIKAEHIKRFRIGKFINEVPNFNKDKRGMNINILILQILFLLEREQFGKIIERVEALKRYSSRYLRKNDTYRSNCFIKMLLLLPQFSFNPIQVQRHATPLLKRLIEIPCPLQDHDVEIVPYETLWKFVEELLGRNSKGKRASV